MTSEWLSTTAPADVFTAAGLAGALDPAFSLLTLIRALHGTTGPPPPETRTLRDAIDRALTLNPGSETVAVPLPLPRAMFDSLMQRPPATPDAFLPTLLRDRRAALLYYGAMAMDAETRAFLAAHPDLVRALADGHAGIVAAFGRSLRISSNRVLVPGGDEAVPLWEDIVGAPVGDPDAFVRRLLASRGGRIAYMFDAIAHLDPPRQRFALGLSMPDSPARLDRLRIVQRAFTELDREWSFANSPFGRPRHDAVLLLRLVPVDEQGAPTQPAGRALWTAAFAGAELPEDPRDAFRNIGRGGPVDAAMLVEQILLTSPPVRRARFDMYAFGVRRFATINADTAPDAVAALRAFARYPAVMLGLERMGVAAPATYVAAGRACERVAAVTQARRAHVVLAQFQGALAIVGRVARTGRLDRARTEALVTSLADVEIRNGRYGGRIAAWMEQALIPALRPVEAAPRRGGVSSATTGGLHDDDRVALVHRAVHSDNASTASTGSVALSRNIPTAPGSGALGSGATRAAFNHIAGGSRNIPMAAGHSGALRSDTTRPAFNHIAGGSRGIPMRAGHSGASGNRPTTAGSSAPASRSVRGSGFDTHAAADAEAVILTAMADRSPDADGRRVALEGFSYVIDITAGDRARFEQVRALQGGERLDDVLAAARQLRARGSAASPRDVDSTDRRLADVLLAIVYAPHQGDPAELFPAAAALFRRHDFGVDRTGITADARRRAPWERPRIADTAGQMRVHGSLLGLDLALARLSVRRLVSDRMPQPPTLNQNDREAVLETAVLLNPRDMSDAQMHTIAAALARGRERIAAARADVPALDRLAETAGVSESRRVVLSWAASQRSGALDEVFTLAEVLRLGAPEPPAAEEPATRTASSLADTPHAGAYPFLDAWGMASEPFDGCYCLAFPDRAAWENLSGRPGTGQIAARLPDLALRLAELLTEIDVPAALMPHTFAYAAQDFVDEAPALHIDDGGALVQQARALTRTRVEDYLAAVAARGPLRPIDQP